MGVQDSSRIPDSSLNASSYFDDSLSPRYGRLGSERAWCPGFPWSPADYLQVAMGAEHAVCAVATQGHSGWPERITRYKLAVSRDGGPGPFIRKTTQPRWLSTGSMSFPYFVWATQSNSKFEYQTLVSLDKLKWLHPPPPPPPPPRPALKCPLQWNVLSVKVCPVQDTTNHQWCGINTLRWQ